MVIALKPPSQDLFVYFKISRSISKISVDFRKTPISYCQSQLPALLLELGIHLGKNGRLISFLAFSDGNGHRFSGLFSDDLKVSESLRLPNGNLCNQRNYKGN